MRSVCKNSLMPAAEQEFTTQSKDDASFAACTLPLNCNSVCCRQCCPNSSLCFSAIFETPDRLFLINTKKGMHSTVLFSSLLRKLRGTEVLFT